MKSPYDVILSPIVTEKSMDMMNERKYTFRVDKKANKAEIKEALEAIFDGVKVKSVNTMNVLGKKTRVGNRVGKKSDWKKAIVTLKEDSKTIAFFENM
ncbi:50S ribosomal protein L23 [Peptoniphilaceae bacterium SGI.131]